MVTFKKPKEIEILKKGGKILADILRELIRQVKPGIITAELDKLAEKLILQQGGLPSFKGYKNSPNSPPFPTAICASLNEQVVHTPALPNRQLKLGDILSIDIGLKYPAEGQGFFTDMAITIPVGRVSKIAKKLIKVTKIALDLGVLQVKPNNYISDISRAIQTYVESQGFSVVRQLVGHGVGYQVHEEPRIPNYIDLKEKPVKLKPGMVLALEPMVTVGDWHLKTLFDDWTMVTVDGSLSAHFEHTVVVTERGGEVLTSF